ncbi:hypothetical protein QGM71_08450 [Virgibacillus sp. C22-A2]|uniref:YycO n=1 Tax=Virgibacillus tibetensis TaxID=3042313 RepID=A0ABU6KDV3_9BACI|nr:hypothetical protein [Virgibacillus sp. C22-A2]
MKKSMLRMFMGVLIVVLVFANGISISASSTSLDKNVTELVKLQPGITLEEVEETVAIYAKAIGKSEIEASNELLEELNAQLKADEIEQAEQNAINGGSSGNYKLPIASRKGDIFYTPSSTLGIQHGHNGIYYTTTTIAESIPSTGVRYINYRDRNVERNAVVQYVNTSTANRNAAADWARSRTGDSYSYNFATNRLTGHYGAKNCSKLLWSAFKLKAGIDIDVNLGGGVYPKDIRDSGYTVTYRVIS